MRIIICLVQCDRCRNVNEGLTVLPDKRRHRGPHPEDVELFAPAALNSLRSATDDLSLLLSKGYAPVSALKLVGDRYALAARQRLAVARCACSAQAAARRREHEVGADQLSDAALWIDGYNVLTSIEAALSGGVILHARDGCYRDMASMHGSYRKVEETYPALQVIGELCAQWHVATCHWILDEPVSNSGRLKTLLVEFAQARGWNWHAETARNADAVLIQTQDVVASADSQIIDKTGRWFNLAKAIIAARVDDAWIIDLSRSAKKLAQNC